MNALRRLWKGDFTLPQAFWNWAVARAHVNCVSGTDHGRPDRRGLGRRLRLSVYNIVAMVGVWRSAGHHEGEHRWADLARFVTVCGMIILSVT
jgi:hypothetical protein